MIYGVIALASYSSYGGGSLGNLFAQWEAEGIFQYALPFLLIFALVFGLLSKLNLFQAKDGTSNRGINAIISLAVAFMALQFDLVSMFFSEIFPRFGVALSIILVILILGGLFIPTETDNNWFMIILGIIVLIIVGIVIFSSLNAFGWTLNAGGGLALFWERYSSLIILLACVAIVLLITAPKRTTPRSMKYNPPLLQGMRGS